MKPLQKFLLYACLLVVLALVFAMYGQPDFFMSMANQIWGCF